MRTRTDVRPAQVQVQRQQPSAKTEEAKQVETKSTGWQAKTGTTKAVQTSPAKSASAEPSELARSVPAATRREIAGNEQKLGELKQELSGLLQQRQELQGHHDKLKRQLGFMEMMDAVKSPREQAIDADEAKLAMLDKEIGKVQGRVSEMNTKVVEALGQHIGATDPEFKEQYARAKHLGALDQSLRTYQAAVSDAAVEVNQARAAQLKDRKVRQDQNAGLVETGLSRSRASRQLNEATTAVDQLDSATQTFKASLRTLAAQGGLEGTKLASLGVGDFDQAYAKQFGTVSLTGRNDLSLAKYEVNQLNSNVQALHRSVTSTASNANMQVASRIQLLRSEITALPE